MMIRLLEDKNTGRILRKAEPNEKVDLRIYNVVTFNEEGTYKHRKVFLRQPAIWDRLKDLAKAKRHNNKERIKVLEEELRLMGIKEEEIKNAESLSKALWVIKSTDELEAMASEVANYYRQD